MTHDPRIRRTIDELVAGDVPPGPSIDDIARRVQRRVRRRAVAAGAACLGVAGLTWVAVAPADSDGTTIASGRADLAALPPEDLATFCLETLDAPVPADLTVFLGESEAFDRIEGSGLDSRAEICSGVIKDALGESAEAVAAPADVPSTSPEQELALADDVVTFEEYEAAMARHTECSAAVGIEITPTYSEAAGQFSYELVADVPGVVDPLIAHDACYQWHVAKIEAAYVTESTRSVPTQAPETDAVASVLDPIELGPDEWPFPSWLPAGLEFDFAWIETAGSRRIVFTGPDGLDGGVGVTIALHHDGLVDPDAVTEDDFVVVGEEIWFHQEPWGIVRETTAGWLSIADAEPGVDAEIPIAASLEIVAASALPRPPLDLDRDTFLEATSLSAVEGSTTLSATTDGRYVAIATGSDGEVFSIGCCHRLEDDELASVTSWSVTDGDDPGIVEGIADPSVATLEIVFVSGEIVEIVPEDRSGTFGVNFFLAWGPASSDDLFASIASIRAFDAEGAVLGETDLPADNRILPRAG